MKKLIMFMALLGFVSAGMSAFAYIDTNRLWSEDYLRNQNYSPETIRMMNLKRIDPYAPYVEEEKENTPVNWGKRLYQYFNPAVDNGKFGTGTINPGVDAPSNL